MEEQLRKKANDDIKLNLNLFIATSTKRNYSINDLKSDIATIESDIASFIVDDDSRNELSLLLKEVQLADIVPIQESKPNFSKFYDETRDIIRKKIKPSVPITDLVNDSLLQEWVRQGIEKHKGLRANCAFCGNPINKQLWAKLDAHFSQESEALREAIVRQVKILESAKERLQGFIQLDQRQFYGSLQSEFNTILGTWTGQVTQYLANIEILIFRLKERERDIFTEGDLLRIEDLSDDLLDTIKAFNRLIGAHANKTKTLSADQEKIRLQLRLNEVANFVISSDYKVRLEALSLQRSIVEANRAELRERKDVIDQLFEQKAGLELKAKDEGKGAELINKHLKHFFGHADLRLRPEGDAPTMKFVIERDGNRANNLSEGECSLISFCYFIAKIEDELKGNLAENGLIVYIDDPISSLDSNHIFFMFSLIENIIAKPLLFSQLFISTHNLDFLKYLKRLTIPKYKVATDSKPKPDVNYFIVERASKSSSKLKIAPDYLRNYTTEFNYLFKQIYLCSRSSPEYIEDELQYSFGNNMRKFLESYLFYKYPSHKLTNDQRIEKFFQNDHVAFSLVNRVTNEYSHLENRFDRSLEPVDVESMNQIAVYVIERMKEADPDQYDALVESIQ